MKKILQTLTLACATAFFAAGCGGEEQQQARTAEGAGASRFAPASEGEAGGARGAASQQAASPARSPNAEPVATAAASGEAREIVIQANDQMKFDVEAFEVKAGEQIRLVLNNVGTMPKMSMGHNVVILQKEVDPNAFAEAAMMAPANDYIPPSSASQIVAHTKMLGGGESDTITFIAPKNAGEYPYLCSFPGHFQIGMRGVMTVR